MKLLPEKLDNVYLMAVLFVAALAMDLAWWQTSNTDFSYGEASILKLSTWSERRLIRQLDSIPKSPQDTAERKMELLFKQL